MNKIEMRNGIEIDVSVAERIKQRVLREEDWNQRTNEKTTSEMVKLHMKILEEEVNAY